MKTLVHSRRTGALDSYFSHCCSQMLDESNRRKESFLLPPRSGVPFIIEGKPWWQECEVAGHLASSQETTNGERWSSASNAASLFSPYHAVVPPTFRIALPTLKDPEIPTCKCPEVSSHMALNPVKFTRLTISK